ncbi:Asp23/Gls24 family envelope stress response protein [Candidatus Formimonas warabiya]|uniref:Asp23/Gls24 family envelope stress response protein n=1 Tax=Formimonas warabiya TaxID=1761012 RepID=A0A3G1KPG9_FORW1|nr:Asp23/Gls24 family envelope stress response protein [Candidatus Formimonas warabiya]ATW24364.1 hypothetical protein DCMF_05815 [Candidatus Formimonas warabiya]
MQVLAFIGPSGTGKSHHAIFVAQEYHAEMIIDDGLLIQGSRILAGSSAKRSPTKVGAIKTALFTEDAHAEEVKNQIAESQPSRILILGTSTSMVEKIALRLELPLPETVINIDDIVSPESIKKARQIREQLGTHVVPAPTVEVKQRFSGNIIDPLRSFFRKRNPGNRPLTSKHLWVEQTVVRPTFNFWGKFYISNYVIIEIIKYVSLDVPGIDRVMRSNVENSEQGLALHVDVSLVYGYFLPDVMVQAQKTIQKHVEYMTSLNVISIDIHAVKLVMREQGTEE